MNPRMMISLYMAILVQCTTFFTVAAIVTVETTNLHPFLARLTSCFLVFMAFVTMSTAWHLSYEAFEKSLTAPRRARKTQLVAGGMVPEALPAHNKQTCPDGCEHDVPVAEEVKPAYNDFLETNDKLWRLSVQGNDSTNEAEQLREHMEECWCHMTPEERERADYHKADAWKRLYTE